MKITKEQVEHVANLARLNLTEDEKERLTGEMENIIAFADKLNELDTSGVEPTAHAIPIQNVFREDIVGPSYDREKILANAPSREDGCFKVPKIVE
ncbi:MAG: glutamyl-tRNA(Gln) and/or aspartyl-tRNA(Asn) amidotransferase, subunit [Clostridia bacterium]|jgi:aspartyl-tRNA(Asn)/glutamyl-tRNA(Gln) amidotransferase subunit C|uniref:Asp-tRNA(Asn)/Glu-tRNA(Gln) amidotransferase subunit GatC n=1 Tax=Petroclostridium xylanilyticum TaxID=1792311 RepID=UPI000B97F464|nr:Asp-tRNA(Asn)/Glu-tRNA(Gln) amidotransferase subunit GatC [Petroclostridium xylanilyticum]MBZ4646779.1 glutamyl-tRNA(Gln) and/or aspartyl-tRNA(Asn) amidotransferase, subunit [Clostridia bacterium]